MRRVFVRERWGYRERERERRDGKAGLLPVPTGGVRGASVCVDMPTERHTPPREQMSGDGDGGGVREFSHQALLTAYCAVT